MAVEIARSHQQFPPRTAGESGPLAVTVFHGDGTLAVTITPGSDGAMPPGVAAAGATITARAPKPAPAPAGKPAP